MPTNPARSRSPKKPTVAERIERLRRYRGRLPRLLPAHIRQHRPVDPLRAEKIGVEHLHHFFSREGFARTDHQMSGRAPQRESRTLEAFRAKMVEWRKAGSLVTRGEVDAGSVGIAEPILDPDRLGLGSVSYVVSNKTEDRTITRLAALAVAGAREIEGSLRGG